jgi:hypothetical protein
MDYENQIDNFQVKEERPTFLKVLCILSWISTGIALISGIINIISGPFSEEQMTDQKVEMIKSIDELRTLDMTGLADLFEKIQRMTESMNAQFYYVQFVSLIVVVLGVFGIFKMWNRSKLGFHLYIIYSLLSVLTVYLFVAPIDVPSIVVIINLVISAIFVFMYSRNLKWMK